MKKEEKLKILLKDYLKGRLDETSKEQLFYLVHEENIDESAVCELYKLWQEVPGGKNENASRKAFNSLKEKLQITDEKILRDDLMLKGVEYNRIKTSGRYLSTFMKYAAVLVIAVFIAFYYNYRKNQQKPSEIAKHEISAPHGARIKILLSDSSEVWLNSGSKLIYAENFSTSDREVYLEGEAFFNVRKSNYQPFYINTSKLSIKVLGTSLNVKSYSDEDFIETTLITGQVEIKEIETHGKKAQSAFLLPEQKALYNKETGRIKIEEKKSISPVTIKTDIRTDIIGKAEQIRQSTSMDVAWKDNKFVFNNEAFSNLIVRLERWYNVEFEIKDQEINNFKFTGIFENETIEQAMQAFKIASSIDYKFEKNKITVWKIK